MKTIGLIGGMSYESTLSYYEIINKLINEKLGKLHSAKIVLTSVDFEEIEQCQRTNNWEKASEILSFHAKKLEKCGVDFILICTNTMHKCFDEIQKNIKIPILHIAHALLLELKKSNISSILLLGTKYTLLEDFYKNILAKEGIEVIVPNLDDIERLNNIIFDELCKGHVRIDSQNFCLKLLASYDTQAVALACTELSLLIKQSHKLLFDTTFLHAKTAVLKALEQQ